MTAENGPAEEYWNARYNEKTRIWSGKPNLELVRETDGLTPGAALDLGSGEGGDAIWLAQQGWQVTGVDVSSVALERAAEHAEESGVAGKIDWQQHDLGKTFPEGTFDLVSAHFLHSTVELPREAILRTAAEAVAPGGILLIVGHLGFPDGEKHQHHPEIHFPQPAEVISDLALDDGRWEILVSQEHEREQVIEGKQITRRDCTVKARRLVA